MSVVTDRYARLVPSAIVVPEGRQRRDVELDEPFLNSLARGIMQPLLVTKENVLVAGGRRLAGAKARALADVPVRYVEDGLSHEEIELIELEENVRRKDLSWQDEARAVARLHELYCKRDETWNQSRSDELLGFRTPVYLRVARALDDEDEARKIANAVGVRAAYNICTRIDERTLDGVMDDLGTAFADVSKDDVPLPGVTIMASGEGQTVTNSVLVGEGGVPSPTSVPTPPLVRPRVVPVPDVIHADFIEWLSTYEGYKFNFIHCDFPYGKKVFGGPQGGKNAEEEFKYDDDPQVYWTLCRALCENLDKIASPNAHLMFWLSADIEDSLAKTLVFFREHAPGLIFQPRALIWHKTDNVGIVPDVRRGPRWTYETALMATRGDRVIVKPVGASYGAPTARTLHPSTKPEPVLRHFFSMFVDNTTRMLDPTCGAGSALRAADSLGALSVLGIEKSENYVQTALKALAQYRTLKEFVS